MSAPEVIRVADAQGLARRAATMIAVLIEEARRERGGAHVALTGGTTPAGAYRQLRLPSWAGVVLWFGDERCVGPADPESNYGMAEAALLGHAAGATVHRIEGERGAEAAAEAYERLVRAEMPRDASDVPLLDVLLLGIGEDGHVASLFPGNPGLQARGRAVIGVHDAPKPPPDRVSLTLEVLRAARTCVLMATGAGKAEAVAGLLRGPDEAVPASLLTRERLVVVADDAALAGTG